METYHMKNTPIGEGYKFFALTTTNGIIANFNPNGRTASKTGEKQSKRFGQVATRASDAVRDIDAEMGKFCLAMDNYFTVPSVMKHLRYKGIGVVGTARARKGWPPSASQKVEQKDCGFNELRYLIDDDGTLIAKWMDNGLVLFVSTLHAV
eukprot:7443421-Ditylum_brightwellii.AAC.1